MRHILTFKRGSRGTICTHIIHRGVLAKEKKRTKRKSHKHSHTIKNLMFKHFLYCTHGVWFNERVFSEFEWDANGSVYGFAGAPLV